MKAIILAGGYAKRLWPLTKETPKPLLHVGEKEIITRIIEKIEHIHDVNEIIISTNAKFGDKFKEYIKKLKSDKKITLVVEPSESEDKKLGSIGGLNYLIDLLKINEDVLIIGGDNIFEFDLPDFLNHHKLKETSIIALKKIENHELIKQYGVCVLDKDNAIVMFQEKPEKPLSNFASTACYLFKHKDLVLLKKYLKDGHSPDAMGFFISWLIKNSRVHGYVFEEDWFDIGSFESLEEARQKYGKK